MAKIWSSVTRRRTSDVATAGSVLSSAISTNWILIPGISLVSLKRLKRASAPTSAPVKPAPSDPIPATLMVVPSNPRDDVTTLDGVVDVAAAPPAVGAPVDGAVRLLPLLLQAAPTSAKAASIATSRVWCIMSSPPSARRARPRGSNQRGSRWACSRVLVERSVPTERRRSP